MCKSVCAGIAAGLALMLCATLGAQVSVTLGLPNSGNAFPFNFATYASPSMRYQVAYSGTEINLPGGGQLTEIQVRKLNGSIPTYNNMRIRVAYTTLSTTGLTQTFDNNYTPPLQTVLGDPALPGTNPLNFQAQSIIVGSEEWVRFPFANSFTYNGTGTILVDWSMDGTSGAGWTVGGSGRTRCYMVGATATGPATAQNAPDSGGNWQVKLIFTVGPQLTVAAVPGVSTTVFANAQGPGGNGIEAGKFSIASNNLPGCVMTGIELTASGTGNDATAFSEVDIYRDTDNSGAFEFANDSPATTQPGVFAVDDGALSFTFLTAEQGFGTNETHTFFIVVKMASTAHALQTFQFAVTGLVVAANTSSGGLPSAVMLGLTMDTPVFICADDSATGTTMALLGTGGNICQEFTIEYPNGPADRPSNISVSSFGTADEVADLTDVQLWWDSDQSGDFNSATDTLIDTQVFTLDNGVVDFDLSSHTPLQPGTTRRYFVAYTLNLNAQHQATFQCFVSAVTGAALGGTPSGLPIPGLNGTPGLVVSARALIATLNGPGSAITVNSTAQGMTGDGELLCDVTLSATPGASWDVVSLTFHASGTGTHDTAFSHLALHEDDGNTTWDGTAIDGLAAPAALGFSGGAVTFTLNTSAIPSGTERRFFLAGRLNGTALAGQTFNASLDSVAATPPTGGNTSGFPTPSSVALIIDAAALTVGNGPNQPSTITHRAGATGEYTIAQFQLSALNGPATVNGMTLSTAGTGDWTSDVDATSGIQVYQDDGDGIFNAADTLVYQGAGGATVTASFTSGINLNQGTPERLWVRLKFTATAGVGAISSRETFSVSVAAPGDVVANVPALLGSPAPTSVTVGAIEFNVTSFTPANDLPAGGKLIMIQGTGFVAPFVAKIGGVTCPGIPNITGGTQVTGLVVPPGGGSGLAIEITSGNLPPQTLTQTFNYSKVGEVGGTGSGSSSGCGTDTGGRTGILLLLALGACAATVWRKSARRPA